MILALVIVLGILFYTAETLDVINIIGGHTGFFVKNVYEDIQEKNKDGDFDPIKEDVSDIAKKVKEKVSS